MCSTESSQGLTEIIYWQCQTASTEAVLGERPDQGCKLLCGTASDSSAPQRQAALTEYPACGLQASLERVGLDASRAVARARSRSLSRVGRKRLRDASAGAAEAMDVGGSQAPEKKRIHSAKSRRAPLLPSVACVAPSLA